MSAARRKALNEDQIHLETVVNEGLRRVDDAKAVTIAHSRQLRGLRGVTGRTRRTLRQVAVAKLDNASRTVFFASAAIATLIGKTIRPETQRKIESAAEGTTKFLATKDLLDKLK